MLRTPFDSFSWLATIVLALVVAIFMFRRRLHRTYAAFVGYFALDLILTASLFWIRYVGPHTSLTLKVYFDIYWGGELLKGILRFLVLAELYRQLFNEYEGLQRLMQAVFRWAAAVLLLVAALVGGTMGANADWLTKWVVVVDSAAMLFACGLLIFLFAFSSYFNLGWRHYAVGIALGFAIHTPLFLINLLLQAQRGYAGVPLATIIVRAGYSAALLVWLAYLALPQPEEKTVQALPSHQLSEWNRALQEYMR